jgi:hypothetical protein
MEIIVAMTILAVVMVGLANISLTGKRHILHTRARMTATELGKVFLDPLQMDVRYDQWGGNCLSREPYNSTLCPTLVPHTISGVVYTPTYSIEGIAGSDCRRAQLTVTWNE